jgi:hypothetical protein
MGIVNHSQKKFEIPSKAPFAEKMIKEYKTTLEERKKLKNKEIFDNGMKFKDPTLADDDEIVEEDKYDIGQHVTSHDKKFFATSFTKYNYLINKVVEKSDVIINVLDARDPLSCISQKLIQKAKLNPQKKILFVLNKIDLIPEA